jgi:hypothetical protein
VKFDALAALVEKLQREADEYGSEQSHSWPFDQEIQTRRAAYAFGCRTGLLKAKELLEAAIKEVVSS